VDQVFTETTSTRTPDRQAFTSRETSSTGLQELKTKTSRPSNDAVLHQLLDSIDLGDRRLFGKTTTTKRPYRFRPATKREQIRKKAQAILTNEAVQEPTTVQPTNKHSRFKMRPRKINLNQGNKDNESNEIYDSFDNAESTNKIVKLKNVRKINDIVELKPIVRSFKLKKIRRRPNLKHKQNIVDRKNINPEETSNKIINETEEYLNYTNETNDIHVDLPDQVEVNDVKDGHISLNVGTNEIEDTKKTENEQINIKHPFFNSFPIVKSIKENNDANEQLKEANPLEKLHKKLVDSELYQNSSGFIDILAEIEKDDYFDVAAVKSEMNAMKLNRKFLIEDVKITPKTILFDKENLGDSSQDLALEQDKISSKPESFSVFLPPVTTPSTNTRIRMNRKRNPARLIEQRTHKIRLDRTATTDVGKQRNVDRNSPASKTGTFSLLSWDQLSY